MTLSQLLAMRAAHKPRRPRKLTARAIRHKRAMYVLTLWNQERTTA